MKIALVGYGQMGHIIEKVALERGHEVITTIDPHHPEASHKNIADAPIEDVDICIIFAIPESLIENVTQVALRGKNIVIGTTGWLHRKNEVTKLIHDNNIGGIYAPNFSLGVNLFLRMIRHAARIMDKYSEYDVAGIEYHHNKKKDSPSGTAKAMTNILLENLNRKESIVYDIVDRQIAPEEMHFASVRCGNMPGTHSIIFDSAADTITLTHQARNREGFAWGAVAAAEWIVGKRGLFDMDAFMDNFTSGL